MVPRLDDLFLGIGAILLLVTFSVGTYVVELADDVKRAMASGNVMGVSDRVDTILKCWYTASATYNFSVVCTRTKISKLTWPVVH